MAPNPLPHTLLGEGLPLVLLHAFPLSRTMWDDHLPALSPRFKVITFDLPGFGEAPPESDVLTMETAAARVIESLDALAVRQPVTFLGLSMGGYVLFQIARLFPERVRSLVLVSTRAAADTPQAKDGREKAIELVQTNGLHAFAEGMLPKLFSSQALESDLASVQKVKKWMEEADPKGVCAALRGMRERPNSEPLLEQIKSPTLVLGGDEDGLIPIQEMKNMAQGLPRGQFRLISGAGHLLNLEKPEEFESIMEKREG